MVVLYIKTGNKQNTTGVSPATYLASSSVTQSGCQSVVLTNLQMTPDWGTNQYAEGQA